MSDTKNDPKNDGNGSPKSGTFTRKKLTPFLAHEMIYDYATNQLDPERRAALDEFLAKDQESQALLKNILAAQEYSAKLSKISVNDEVLGHLQEAESAVSLGRRYSSWREWPETLRWSITAIALSAVVAGSVALVPWSKFTSTKKAVGPESVEVAQIPNPKPEDTTEVAANEDNGSGDEAPDDSGDEGSGDDVADSGASESGGGQKTAPVAAVKPSPTPVQVAANAKSSNPQGHPATASAVAVNPSPTPAPGTNASARIAIAETPDSHAAGDSKARGFVYRAFMTLDNLEEIAPKIKDDIVSLGGEKAGEVELGWKRGTGHYYHFALPQENEKKVLERLQVYGPVRISKDPHPRVMPPGKVRFILWVESAPDTANQ